MIEWVLWLRSPLGRLASGAMAIGIVFVAWQVDRAGQRKVGVEKERARVQTQGAKTDAKAQSARRAAEQRPADSLRSYLRD